MTYCFCNMLHWYGLELDAVCYIQLNYVYMLCYVPLNNKFCTCCLRSSSYICSFILFSSYFHLYMPFYVYFCTSLYFQTFWTSALHGSNQIKTIKGATDADWFVFGRRSSMVFPKDVQQLKPAIIKVYFNSVKSSIQMEKVQFNWIMSLGSQKPDDSHLLLFLI